MNRRVVILPHALEQYCSRVEPIDHKVLTDSVQMQVDRRYWQSKKKGHSCRRFIHVDGVWWVCRIQKSTIYFVTCYGRGNMDLPAALIWAELHNDRINLNDLLHPEVRRDEVCPADSG